MDSDTVALVVAGIGVAGTLAASVAGYAFNARQDTKSWERAELRDRETRTYDAYLRYLMLAEQAFSRGHMLWAEPAKRTKEDIDRVADTLEEFATAQTAVMLHGSPEVRRLVPPLYNTIAAMVNLVVHDWDNDAAVDDATQAVLAEISAFRNQVRIELG